MDKVPEVVVSFIVIAYNEQHRIPITLKSILSQVSKHNFEIIVVNDGSKDETYNVADKSLKEFKNYKIVNLKENVGRGSARHLGSSIAAGNYLAFIDSDVELPSNWLDRTVSQMSNGTDAVSGIAIPDGDCVVIARISGLTPKIRPGTAKLTGNNLLIRKSTSDLVPFRKIPYGDDIRLAWDLEIQGFRTEQLTDLVVKHSERKSYRTTILWQYQQGKDASLLLLEYHKLRIPDAVWLSSILLTIFCALPWPEFNFFVKILFALLSFIALVSGVFIHSRFTFNVLKPQTYFALLANIPMMTSYLVGRFLGILVLLRRTIRATSKIRNHEKR
jgi:glycosyltransferase involved in cell wall biosynthesis